MKSFLKFLAVVLTILLLSAILAPILFRFLPFKFEKIFNRLIMIFSLLSIAAFVRFDREKLKNFGLLWQKNESLKKAGIAFLSGILTLMALAGVMMLAGRANWHPVFFTPLSLFLQIVKLLATAFLIAFIEEFFFRGFVLSSLTKNFTKNLLFSVIMTNLFYALIHFIRLKKPFVGPDPTFFDSLRLMAVPFVSLAKWHDYWPEAIGLFCFGLVLTDIVIRTRSLYPAIGLHAGCVFYVKMDELFVDFMGNHSLFFWGTKKMYDGLLGWLFLLSLGWVLRYLIKNRKEGKSL